MSNVIMETGTEKKRIHPQKFALWIAMASIIMMFAGLTSAYIVRKAQGNWVMYHLPSIFWVSTAAIVFSSVTIILGTKAFKQRQMPRFKMLISVTLILGILFAILQYLGFQSENIFYENSKKWGGLPAGQKVEKAEPLFPRITEESKTN